MPKNIAHLYNADFVAWTEKTVHLLRTGQFKQVEWEAVIEEIESLESLSDEN